MKVLNFPSAYRAGERPYDIFKDRMTAITSITGGIKDMISNKYINKQMAMIAENIQSEIDKQKVIDLTHLISGSPPDEIYPANLEDTIGQFIDKFTMGPMMRKETMIGGLPSVGGATPTPTTEAMIPKTDLYQLYNAIKELPSGKVSWDNIYKQMTEKKPWFMGTTGPEQYVIDQMMGQSGDPRAKMTSDINLAKLVKDSLFPEEEGAKIKSEIDFFRLDPVGYAEMLKLKQSITGDKKTAWEIEAEHLLKFREAGLISDDELKKGMGVYIKPEEMSEFDKKFALAQQLNLTDDEWKKFFGVLIPEETVIQTKFYKTPNEVIASEPKIPGMMIDPTLDKTKGWYANYVKETKEDPNNYLFGKKDVYGNISRMGIIPYDAQTAISYGQPLTDIQKTQIKNNHNLQKSLLDEEMLVKVEAILSQIGIDLTKVIPTIETEEIIEETPEPKPAEWWEFWKKEAPKMQPIWGLDEIPKTEGIPSIKVPTEEKEAMIPTMSNKELYDALYGLDQTDPIYKSLYDEAVKRGLITK